MTENELGLKRIQRRLEQIDRKLSKLRQLAITTPHAFTGANVSKLVDFGARLHTLRKEIEGYGVDGVNVPDEDIPSDAADDREPPELGGERHNEESDGPRPCPVERDQPS